MVKIPTVQMMAFLLPILLLASSHNGHAAQSIWSNHTPNRAQVTGTYRDEKCPTQPPAAYTGHLQLESKYDQSDASKSRLTEQDDATRQINQQVKQYINGLVKAAQTVHNAKKAGEASVALACLNSWLDAWANESALLSDDASGAGIAARKWALAAISSTLLKVRALSDNRYQLSFAQAAWLGKLSAEVMAEYEPRRHNKSIVFNNHDYWAAWAVAATAMLLNDERGLAWADVALRRAFDQLTSGQGDYYYLPLEVARGRLAADYTHYALVPLMLLVEAAEHNGRQLTKQELAKLSGFATFAARAVIEPTNLAELKERQAAVNQNKMVWVLPFLNRFPQHQWVRRLYQSQGSAINHYGQVGGDLKPLYPGLE